MCQDTVVVKPLSDNSFLLLPAAIATKQSLSEVGRFNYSRLQLHSEVAAPLARNDSGNVIAHWSLHILRRRLSSAVLCRIRAYVVVIPTVLRNAVTTTGSN
jgi:hypothetical protein